MNQGDAVLLAGGRIERANVGKGVECDLVGVVIKRFCIVSAKVCFGVKKEITENDGAEILNGFSELFVGVVGGDSFLQFVR